MFQLSLSSIIVSTKILTTAINITFPRDLLLLSCRKQSERLIYNFMLLSYVFEVYYEIVMARWTIIYFQNNIICYLYEYVVDIC